MTDTPPPILFTAVLFAVAASAVATITCLMLAVAVPLPWLTATASAVVYAGVLDVSAGLAYLPVRTLLRRRR